MRSTPLASYTARSSINFARIAGLLSAAFGGAAQLGWYMEGPLVDQGLQSSIITHPNVAAGFIVAGVALFLLTFHLTRPVSRMLGLVLIVGGGIAFNADFATWFSETFRFLLPEAHEGIIAWVGGAMAPGAAISFVLTGAVLLLTARDSWVSVVTTEVLLAGILVLAITSVVGHSYDLSSDTGPVPLASMPAHVAVLLALNTAGLSAACPDRGFAKALTDSSAGGRMIRRLLPGIIVIPILLGWLVHRGRVAELYSTALATAILAVTTIVVMGGFCWVTAVALRRSDWAREEALVELHGQRERLRTTLDSIADAVIATDNHGLVEMMNPVAEKLTGWSVDDARGKPVSEIFHTANAIEPNSAGAAALASSDLDIAMVESTLTRRDGNTCPVECVSSPILNARGRVAGAVLIFRDISERRQAEQQQQMLVSELNHRVRNVLMIVHSLVQASAQNVDTKSAEEMAKVLADRLQSLSRAHELLLETQWSGASLKSMVERELEPYRIGETGNITIKGSDVLLPPQCTSVVAMALHELATNAAKYGALSSPKGKLDVRWSMRGSTLTVKWKESGLEAGTMAAAKANAEPHAKPRGRGKGKPGFGMRLIDKGIRHNLGGDAKLEFLPDGLFVTLQIPITKRPASRPAMGVRQVQ
ncbi:MAG: sensor histidine kinase [Hyphomicrobiales bacterium]